MKHINDVQGAGGGGGSGGKGGGGGKEAPNTLFSDAKARMILAYSEGEVSGLKGGLKGVYLDETPVQNDNGTFNFKGLQVWERHGLPDQAVIPGFSQVENTIQINTQVKKNNPVVRQISAANIDAMRLIMTVPSLMTTDDKGNTNGSSVSFMVEVKDFAHDVWENRGTYSITGKATSPWQQAYRIQRPAGSDTWSFRVTRFTEDSNSSRVSNDTFIAAYVEIEEQTSTYPNTALLALEVDTAQFGSSIPKLSLKVDGIKVPVPSNYHEDNVGTIGGLVYDGVWDGNFVYAATSNPVWNYMEIIKNERFGLGLPDFYLDKFALYSLARYCDAVDDNGVFTGVDNGLNNGKRRRRFSVQTQMTQAEDALQMLQAMASSMRAITYWGAGVLVLNADRPKQSVKIFGNENVVDGKFVYSSTEHKERYSGAQVSYNDPNDFFRLDVVEYNDPAALARYGKNILQVTKYGCASRSEATMFAKWLVDTSLTQTETVNFKCGPEGAVLRPGDMFEIADSRYQGGKFSGRVMPGSTTTKLVVDAPITLNAGQSYKVRMVMADGQNMMESNVTLASIDDTAKTELLLSPALPEAPTVEHMFIVAGSDIQPRKFTCLIVKEDTTEFSYEISAVYYDPNKFERVELDHNIPADLYTQIDLHSVMPPTNLQFQVQPVRDDIKGPSNNLVVSWTPSPSLYVTSYEVLYRNASAASDLVQANGVPMSSGQFRSLGFTSTNDFTIEGIAPGIHQVVVVGINLAGRRSAPADAYYTFNYGGASALQPPVNIRVKGGATTFATPDLTVAWDDNPVNADIPEAILHGWKIQVLSNDVNKAVLYTDSITDPATREYHISNNILQGFGARSFIVSVRARDTAGALSSDGEATLSNPAPAVPGAISTVGFFNVIRVIHNQPAESDAVGTLMFASQTSGFTPSAATLVHEGVGTFHDAEALASTSYFVRIAVYDTFSRDFSLLNISSEYPVATAADDTVVAPPDAPTGLALTTSATGNVISIDATWNALTAETFTSYELAIKEGAGNYLAGYLTGTNSYRWTGLRGATTYTVKVRAKNSIKDSSYSTAVAVTTAAISGGDPAATINAGTTTIDPGHILISGSTTLANWRNGADATKIDGGNIAANTITANKITIGNRNVAFGDLSFTPSKISNTVAWSSGFVEYIDDDATVKRVSLAAGQSSSVVSSAAPIYVYWAKGATQLVPTTVRATAYGVDNIVVATYTGGVNLLVNYGATVIDGDQIQSGTIKADRIEANSIGANQLSTSQLISTSAQLGTAVVDNAQIVDGSITTAKIANAQITAAQIADATITSAKIVSLDANKINVSNLSALSANMGDVTAGVARSSDSKFRIDFTAGYLIISE